MASKEYIERLQGVIRLLHQCEPAHLKSVHVKESLQGDLIWEGDVETFSLAGHPEAKRCYAWSFGEPEQFIAILELPPVDSPASAVKAGIAALVKRAIDQ